MTAKKDMLLKALGKLLTGHSPSDWSYVADNLEQVAALARQFAEFERQKRQKRKGPTKAKRATGKSQSAPQMSTLTRGFYVFLTENIGRRAGPNLRDVAALIGIKSELPNNSTALLDLILRYLEKLSESERAERIQRATAYVQQYSPSQSDEYSRWVSLITKGRSSLIE